MRRNLRPPVQEYNKQNNENSTSQSKMSNQNLPRSNINNNDIKTPFQSSRTGQQFMNPNQQTKKFDQNTRPFQRNDQNDNYNNQSKPQPQFQRESYNENQRENQNNQNINNFKANQENIEEENNNYNKKHKTSQTHKTPDNDYSINPNQIPRPNQNDEIFMNNEKLPFYETAIGTQPPHSYSLLQKFQTMKRLYL